MLGGPTELVQPEHPLKFSSLGAPIVAWVVPGTAVPLATIFFALPLSISPCWLLPPPAEGPHTACVGGQLIVLTRVSKYG
jgi:hypothetical protein